ncbi:MAG TPA: hypothetical protein VIG24_17525 [Acidimicrobiia bacterium]
MTTKPTLVKSEERYELWSWKDCHHHLAELTDEIAEAITTCTADQSISFSYTSGSGIDGQRISCARIVSEPKFGTDWREPLPGDGATLDTRGQGCKFGLAMGYLVEYRRKPR